MLPNYKDFPTLYNHYSAFKGRDVYSSYVYWILKNNGIDNIKLVDSLDKTKGEDLIFFHFDNLKAFNFDTSARKVQFVSDRPLVSGCSKYLSSDITACTGEYSKHAIDLLPSSIIEKRYSVEIDFFPNLYPVILRNVKYSTRPRKRSVWGYMIM